MKLAKALHLLSRCHYSVSNISTHHFSPFVIKVLQQFVVELMLNLAAFVEQASEGLNQQLIAKRDDEKNFSN